MSKQQLLELAERAEAIKALLLAIMGELPKWDDNWTNVLEVELKAGNGDAVVRAEATPAAYLALIDEFGLRDAFDVIQASAKTSAKAAMIEDE